MFSSKTKNISPAALRHIAELGSRIASNTATIKQYYLVNNNNGLSTPPFSDDDDDDDDDDDALDFSMPIGTVPPEIEAARQAVVDDTHRLNILMQDPNRYLAELGVYANELIGIQGVVRFRIAHLVPLGGTATFAELATAAGIGETHMRRLLRTAMAQHVFREPRPGVVAHTAASRALADDALLHQWLAWTTGEGWLASYGACEAMARWPGSEEPAECGFAVTHGGKGTFEYLSEHPEDLLRFADMMRFLARGPDLEPRFVIDGFPWGELPEGATVVDVGGSHGDISCAIAQKFPALNFVVQDLDEAVIREAETKRPQGVADRVKYMAHNFLTEQPIHGAEVYLLRSILHNWSDKYAVRILRNLIPALKPGSKIVINDIVIPENVPHQAARPLRAGVMMMNVHFNSSDRELAELARVFAEASPGFDFKGGHQPAGSRLWIVEAEWKGLAEN